MKKFLFLVFTAILFVSCEKDFTTHNNDRVSGFDIYKFEYENHKYLFVERGYYRSATGGVVHDPNCSCFHK